MQPDVDPRGELEKVARELQGQVQDAQQNDVLSEVVKAAAAATGLGAA